MASYTTKSTSNGTYRIIAASPMELSTQYIGTSVKKSSYNGVNGGFFSSASKTGALNIHYTRGQSTNHLSQPAVNQWTFYISDDSKYADGIRVGCTNALSLTALEKSVGKIYFAIGGKDFTKANYAGGGDYDGVRNRTVIARLNSQVHLIQTPKVKIETLKTDLVALGYSLSSSVNLDGGGSSQLKYNGTTYDPTDEDRAVPFMIKLK